MDFAAENIDANFVRAQSNYFSSTDDKYYIEKVFNLLFKVDSSVVIKRSIQPIEEDSGIRMVVDFISCGKIKSYVLISSDYYFFAHIEPNEEIKYRLLERQLCPLKKIIPFFDELDYSYEGWECPQ